jgi:cell division transport system permease protein
VRWRFVFSEMALGLRRNLSMTIASVLTIWIALTFLGGAWLFNKQIDATKDYWFGKIQISVFLTKDATQTERDAINAQLNSLPQVDHVFYESKAEAYDHFKEQFKSVPQLVKNTDPSALPESYRVKLKDPKKFQIVASAVQNMPGVDQVAAEAQALKKIFRLFTGIRNGMLVVALAVLVASILLIFNNVRLAAFSRRRETGIMRLVGASDIYIQAPFILEITVAALVGGLLASALMFAIKAVIVDVGLKSAFGGILTYIGWGAVWSTIPYLLLAGVVIAAITAFGTLQRYLRV